MAKLLDGKVAIVTGAGRGIGRAIAQALAREGASVVAGARSMDEIRETEYLITAAGQIGKAFTVNVAERSSVRELVKNTVDHFGSVHILVNNAGIQGPIGPLVENEDNLWEETVRVNLFGTFHLSQAILPMMIEQKQGKIINLSGGGATAPRPNFSAYAASKVAIVRLTETMAVELREHNIQVNAIAPGAVNTKMLDEVLEAKDRAGMEAQEAVKRSKEGGTPPQLAAELTVFLASHLSDSLTGKLVAAPHDNWREWDESKMQFLTDRPWLSLRRVDPYTIEPLVDDITSF